MRDQASTIESHTGWELSWHSIGKVMCLTISGDYTLGNSHQVNTAITRELDQSQEALTLLINALEMNRPYHFDQIRTTQTFMNHQKLERVYVVANDSVVKLALIIIFNMGRAPVHRLNDMDTVDSVLNKRFSQFY